MTCSENPTGKVYITHLLGHAPSGNPNAALNRSEHGKREPGMVQPRKRRKNRKADGRPTERRQRRIGCACSPGEGRKGNGGGRCRERSLPEDGRRRGEGDKRQGANCGKRRAGLRNREDDRARPSWPAEPESTPPARTRRGLSPGYGNARASRGSGQAPFREEGRSLLGCQGGPGKLRHGSWFPVRG